MDIQGSSRSCSLGRRSRVIERKVLGCMKRFTVRSHIAAYVLVSGNVSPTAPPPTMALTGKLFQWHTEFSIQPVVGCTESRPEFSDARSAPVKLKRNNV